MSSKEVEQEAARLEDELEVEVEGLDLSLEITKLRERVVVLRDEEKECLETVSKLAFQKGTLQADIRRLEDKRSALHESVIQDEADHKGQVRTRNIQMAEIEEAKKAKVAEFQALQATLPAIEARTRAENLNLEALMARKTHLETQIAAQNDQLKSGAMDIQSQEAKVAHLQAEIASAQQKLAALDQKIADKECEHEAKMVAREAEIVRREASASKRELWNREVVAKLRSYKTDLENHYKREFKDLIIEDLT